MDDKERAKALALAHQAALTEWHDPHLEDAERPRIRCLLDTRAIRREEHLEETGWAYEVPDKPWTPGRWMHSTRSFWGWRTEWINDEEETER